LTGYTEDEARGQTPRLLHSGRQDQAFYAALWTSLRDAGAWQGEIWNRRKNGEVYPELLSISAVGGNEDEGVAHFVGVFADISRLKASEAQLEYLAHHDALTGLPNRLLMMHHLKRAIDRSRRSSRIVALLMLDLDRFKDVNDTFGHLAGDELLQQVAERLTRRLRGADTLTRLGGDEFTVLLDDLGHAGDAARVARDIVELMNEPFRLAGGIDVRIGASIGISLFPEYADTAEMLLQQADTALYRAKDDGRGCFKYFSDDQTYAARERIELESKLRRALERDELRVFYQPLVDIASDRVVGAEALLRWQDPEAGLIAPGRFIPVAEETGLIVPIGEWVLREVCRQGRRWIDAGLPSLTLAVNLSPLQFRHGDVGAVVAAALSASDFPADRLELELTESALMEREDDAVETLIRLRGQGVRLAIDDFGTGYSSLAHLKRFPIDVLKIDRSFVEDIPHGEGDSEIAATIIAMGHTLGFRVLAEGVETAEQLAFLRDRGCDLYQGYLRSAAVPAAEFELLV
jgi:diguanylate cyclase (GGDEF)-like protein/PAS domain S-box-containing protein